MKSYGCLLCWKKNTSIMMSMWHSILIGFIVPLMIGFLINEGKSQTEKSTEGQQSIEEKWGVKLVGVRLTAADHFLDFRYMVIDPRKAGELLSRQKKAYLIHQTTGTKMPVTLGKLGPMRTTNVKPEVNRQYLVMFSNTGKIVTKGSLVTVVIGDFKAENIIVQ
jgi:hypothetical protein